MMLSPAPIPRRNQRLNDRVYHGAYVCQLLVWPRPFPRVDAFLQQDFAYPAIARSCVGVIEPRCASQWCPIEAITLIPQRGFPHLHAEHAGHLAMLRFGPVSDRHGQQSFPCFGPLLPPPWQAIECQTQKPQLSPLQEREWACPSCQAQATPSLNFSQLTNSPEHPPKGCPLPSQTLVDTMSATTRFPAGRSPFQCSRCTQRRTFSRNVTSKMQ